MKNNKINQKRPRTIEKPIKTKTKPKNHWKEPKKQKETMFSHTSPPNPAPGPTSVRKHWFFWFFWFVSMVFWFFIGFYWFFNGSGSFLIDFICFSIVFIGFTMVLDSFHWFLLVFHGVLLCFEWPPLVFQCFLWFPYWFWKENQRATIGKPIPADSGTSPELPSEPLPPLASWAPLAGSGPLLPLSLSPVTRN